MAQPTTAAEIPLMGESARHKFYQPIEAAPMNARGFFERVGKPNADSEHKIDDIRLFEEDWFYRAQLFMRTVEVAKIT